MHWYEGVTFSGTGVTSSCELPCGCWELSRVLRLASFRVCLFDKELFSNIKLRGAVMKTLIPITSELCEEYMQFSRPQQPWCMVDGLLSCWMAVTISSTLSWWMNAFDWLSWLCRLFIGHELGFLVFVRFSFLVLLNYYLRAHIENMLFLLKWIVVIEPC